MKDRPILFNAPMVRAVLNCTKTQTRRILDESKTFRATRPYVNPRWEDGRWCCETPEGMHIIVGMNNPEIAEQYSPYGKPGDRLWVRENWAFHVQAIGSVTDEDGPFVYAADEFALQYRLDDKWTPSIHMPRWASRILLEIVSVRVERLQNIGEDDAEAEGIEGISRPTGGDDYQDYWRNYGVTEKQADGWPWFTGDRIASYRSLWEFINGPGSWDANPWVWVTEFKVVKP